MNLAYIKQRLTLYEKLMRLDKPIGTLLLLWPTLWALWIASGGRPGWLLTWIFCLGTLLMRSAGCVMNDLADRDFDAHVKRTRERPLAAGLVSVKEALWLAVALSLAAFCLVFTLNRFAIELSFAALALAGAIRSPNASFRCRRRISASPSASASRWRSRRGAIPCRRIAGGCCWQIFSGPSPTTPSMRWWIATTTSRSASRPPPSRWDATMSPR